MQILKTVPALLLIGTASAHRTLERRDSARAACLQKAVALAKPLADGAHYSVTICFIGKSSLDEGYESKTKFTDHREYFYRHLFYYDCGVDARAHCFMLGLWNTFYGFAPPGADNIAYYFNDNECRYTYAQAGHQHFVGCNKNKNKL